MDKQSAGAGRKCTRGHSMVK